MKRKLKPAAPPVPISEKIAMTIRNKKWKENSFKSFKYQNETYRVGVGSIFEIKQNETFREKSRGVQFRVIVTDKYYLKDMQTNEYWSSPTPFVTAMHIRIGAREGDSAYNGWDFVVWVINDELRVEEQTEYRIAKSKKRKNRDDDEQQPQTELSLTTLLKDAGLLSETVPSVKKAKITPRSIIETDETKIKTTIETVETKKQPKISKAEKTKRKKEYFNFVNKEANGILCPCCGINSIYRDNCSYAHLIATSLGGTNNCDNFVVSCSNCNNDENDDNKQCQLLAIYLLATEGDLSRIYNILLFSRKQKFRVEGGNLLLISITEYARRYFQGKREHGKIESEQFFNDLQKYEEKLNALKQIQNDILQIDANQSLLTATRDAKLIEQENMKIAIKHVDHGKKLEKKQKIHK